MPRHTITRAGGSSPPRATKEGGAAVVLLLHPADLLFDFGLFAVTFGGALLLLIFLASRAHRRA